jgi:Tfp pilus assembly protein PilE
MFNKGAMFGLDARIALAIFGALSVISGAALYSAIQEAKITAIVTQLNELAKAYESHYIDTAEHSINLAGTSQGQMGTIGMLITNIRSSSFWNGPYTSITNLNPASTREIKTQNLASPLFYSAYSVIEGRTPVSASGVMSTCNSTDCNIYLATLNIIDKTSLSSIDIKIDGTDDKDSGKFLYHIDGDSTKTFYYIMAK